MRAFRDIILFISFVMMSGIAYAVPAQQAWMEATTQSGEIILVTLRGDEFYHWYEDLNGNYWEKNDQGLLHMETAARLSKRQEQAQARRIQQQYTTNTDFPKTGTVHVVVLLAQYADKSFVIQDPVEQFTNLYNEHRYSQNGSTGSVRDYYLASSNNMLDVQFDVYGPYTLSKNEEYCPVIGACTDSVRRVRGRWGRYCRACGRRGRPARSRGTRSRGRRSRRVS